MRVIHSHTLSICSSCGRKVQARIVEDNRAVYLEKFCPEHGDSKVLICSDASWFRESRTFIKPNQSPLSVHTPSFRGCPESCGQCSEHQQHTCLPVMEITSTCNLSCPVCLKRFKKPFTLSVEEVKKAVTRLFDYEERVDVFNISGGEPTLHPHFTSILQWLCKTDILQVTVSTNGLRLLHDKQLRRVFKETGSIAAIQFDGFRAHTYKKLRGKDLASEKRALIRLLEAEGVQYSLVTTIVKGVNDEEIGDITDYFFRSKAHSLMFQPVAFTGMAESMYHEKGRMTIPDVVKEIEKSKFVKKGDFNPLPCSHYSCFALSYYFQADKNTFTNIKELLDSDQYLNMISNKTLPGLDKEGIDLIRERIYALWSASDTGGLSEAALKRIKRILQEMNTSGFARKKVYNLGLSSMKAIFIHNFMDAHTFDFGRLIKCCNPYLLADGRLVPMCTQNAIVQRE